MHSFFRFLVPALLILLMGGQAFAAPAQDLPQAPRSQVDSLKIQQDLVPAQQNQIPPLVLQDSLALTPYTEYFTDPAFSADIAEVAAPQNADRFHLFSPDRLPLMGGGATWLRFVLQPVQAGGETVQAFLDMGPSVPGSPVLYVPSAASGSLEWKEVHPGKKNIFRLPEAEGVPLTCFLRLDGLPGPWFSPVIRTAESAMASDAGVFRGAGLSALVVLFVLCLLKSVTEPGSWRFWALLYLAAAFVQAWAGPAPLNTGYTATILAGLTAGGLALVLWSLMARRFLRCRETSRFLDVQFIFLCLPGAAAMLIPLVPGFQWCARYTELWPAALVIFLPSALWACLCRAPHCLRFLLATLIPPAACAAGIMGLRSGFSTDILSALPLLGTALGALFVLAVSRPRPAEAPAEAPAEVKTPADLEMDLAGPRKDGPMAEYVKKPEPPRAAPAVQAAPAPGGLFADALQALAAVRPALEPLGARRDLPKEVQEQAAGLTDAAARLDMALREQARQAQLDAEAARKMQVLVISRNTAFVAVLTHVLRHEDCVIRQARDFEEAVALNRHPVARMFILEGDAAVPAAAETLRTLRAACSAAGFIPLFLAYTPDESSWKQLAKAGFTHALVLPIDDTALINTMQELRDAEKTRRPGAVQAAQAAAGDVRATQAVPDIFGEGTGTAPAPKPAPRPAPAREPAPGVRQAPASQGMPSLDLTPEDRVVVLEEPSKEPAPGQASRPAEAPAPKPAPEPASRPVSTAGEMPSLKLSPDGESSARTGSASGPAGQEALQDVKLEVSPQAGQESRPAERPAGRPAQARVTVQADSMPLTMESPQELRRHLDRCITGAKAAFVKKQSSEIIRLMTDVESRTKTIGTISRLARLVIQAAEADDRTSVRDFLLQLTSSVEKTFGKDRH